MSFIPKIGDKITSQWLSETIDGTVIGLEYDTLSNELIGALTLIESPSIYENFLILDQRCINSWINYKATKIMLAPNIGNYIGKQAHWIHAKHIKCIKKNKLSIKQELDGAFCARCKEFAPYANEGFTCFACKTDPYRFSRLNVDDNII